MKRPFLSSHRVYRLFILLLILASVSPGDEFTAVEYEHQVIYHSPQTPGFTSWVSAWSMPDGSLMTSFTQATGPVEGRPRAPKEIQVKLGWPPPGQPGYDMTGLDLRNVHLRSVDAGKTWLQVSADPFKSCMNGVAEGETALPGGAILRCVWGHYLPYNPEVPQTGYVQRSTDGSKTWGPPELLLDPLQYTAWPKRIRVLRDGRIIVIGGFVRLPANSRTREEYCRQLEPLLLVSKDHGKTWSAPIPVVPAQYRDTWGGEECDAAELPNGDLLFVFRRFVPELNAEARWQGVLQKSGESWSVGDTGPAPFPRSGHPELCATQEGPILHIATTGVDYTGDAGKTWRKLALPKLGYYPRSVQMHDGQILVFAHVGGDDAYGHSDQSIVMDRFRLKKN